MRRILAAVVLLVAALGAPASAQGPEPAPSFQIAQGVTAEALAFMPGVPSPVVYRFRFEPGSSFDAEGDASIGLVTIESGTMTVGTPVELTVYSADGSPRTVAAGTDEVMETGDYFLVPPGAGGRLRNLGTTPASMLIAALYPETVPEPIPDGSADVGASPLPEGSPSASA
jgi:hypothetical protein